MATNLITGLGGPAGFGENALAVGDDNDSGFIDLRQLFPRGINVFGTVYQGLFVNNNGSVSFGAAVGNTTRFALTPGNPPLIAPFLADVDTRGGAIAPSPGGTSTGANRVWYDLDAASGTVTVTWDDVGRFASQTDAANAFQLRLTSVPSPGGVHDGNFDIEFRYEAIAWDTSTSGRVANAVISDGNGVNILHLPGSAAAAGVLALDEGSNVADPGRFAFRSREGVIEPEFSVGPVRIVEGSGIGPRMAEITIQRTSAVSAGSVSYATESATALPYQDYLPRSGIVFFKPGMSSQTILVPVIQDSIPEGAEQFLIRLSNPNGGALTNPTGLVQIDDDDLAPPATPTLALYAAPTRESAGSMLFTATLSAPQASPLVASYSLAGGTANTADFNSTGGTITFAPGTTKASFAVPLVSDTEVEAIQEFSASLTSDALKGQPAVATGTILDDDGFSVTDVVVTEGAGGTFAEFTVTLGSPLAEVATVSFGTSSGTAFQGQDYTALNGILTFAPGTTSQAVKVEIIGDTDNPEPNEQFSLVLSAPSPNTGIAVGKASALIIDDDGISVGDAKVTEINGDTFVDVLITLPAPSAINVSVDWATKFGTAGFFDFDANAAGTVVFSPGDTSETISILVRGDKAAEGGETFRVVLSNPQGSTITDGSGTVTIVDDEASPLIVDIADHEAIDAAGGDVKVAMTVFLNRLHSLPVTVDVALFENGATKGVDYIDAPGTVTIPAGQLSATFDVTLLRADQPETLEGITVAISNPTGGAVLPVPEGVPSATANLAIQSYATLFDLALPAISQARENEWAAAAPVYTLTRRGDMTSQQVVGWAVDYNPGRSSIDSSDLVADQGLVTFAPGQETATFSVDVVGDTDAEGFEFFTLQLVDLPAGSAAGVLPISGISILNDDTTMNLRGPSFPYVGLENGAGPISTPVFSVEIAGDLSVPRTVTWTITGFGPNPADAADFKAMTGTVTIPAKADLVKFTIPVLDDSTIEPTEAYTVTLSDAGKGVTFKNASASSFIANDDYKAALSIDKASQPEGSAGGSTAYAFTITLDPAPPRNFAASFSWKVGPGTVPGTVSADAADFGGFLPSGTAAVGLNAANVTIFVPVAQDTVGELNESFTLTVTDNATGLEIGKASAVILNDDTNLSIAATSANKPEGSDAAPTPYTFTVNRTGNLAQATTAKWSVAGAAGAGTVPADAADFAGGALPSGTVSFAPGQGSQIVTVNVAADFAVEVNERFAITLANPSGGATLTTATAGAVIQNDDTRFELVGPAVSLKESEWAAAPPSFTITRAGNLSATQIVGWTTQTGPSSALLSDFSIGAGTVTFAPGQTQASFKVVVKNDPIIEPSETFVLGLVNLPAGTTAAQSFTSHQILNDDARIIVTPDTGDREGAPGPTATIFVTGDTSSERVLTWTVSPDTGKNNADAADFVATKGTVVLPAGKSSVPFTIPVLNDSVVEPDEGYVITLDAGPNATVNDQLIATIGDVILNDDASLSIAATSANKPEGSGPTPTPYTFTVTRIGDLSKATTAQWSVAGAAGSGTLPANPTDFAGGAFPSGTVSFAAGQTTQLITVDVSADRSLESNERFAVTLANPSAGATIATATAGGLILTDDTAGTGTLSIARQFATRAEGQSGTTDFTFLVSRTGNTTGVAGADWVVTGGGIAFTAAAIGSDFAGGALPSGTVSFAAGETAKTITIPIKGDTVVELNESFTITLAKPSQGVSLGTVSSQGLVWNDDTPGSGTLSIARLAAQKIEGSSGTTAFTFTVTRSGDLKATASADWSVSGGGVAGTVAATASDFAGGILPNGRVSFAVDQTSAVVTVNVTGDIAQELNESFTVTLAGLQAGVALGTASATGAILNDDFVSTPASQALTGTTAVDTFVLGGGIDTVLGLGSRDLFLFQPAALGDGATNAAFLGDFSPISLEALDLSAIDAIDGGGTANDAFTFIGTAAFTGPGQLRWQDLGTLRGIFGSTDADATPELSIFLSTPGPVQAGWFVL